MFDKTMIRGLAAAVVATLLGGTAVADNVILPTQAQLSALGATQYQIVFDTTDSTSGTSGLESTYNTLAATDAAEDSTLNALGATWTAITSTTAGNTYTDASTNAPTYAGVPIFNTGGQLVLSNGAELYTGADFYTSSPPMQAGITNDQYGDIEEIILWTGGYQAYYGTPDTYVLGNSGSYAMCGASQAFDFGHQFAWDTDGPVPATTFLSVYALSSPITPVPEPATLTLLFSALLELGVVYLRRRGANTKRQIMFGKTMVRALMAAALAATMFGGAAMADVILSEYETTPGNTYQIAFVTDGTITGTSGSESTYNSFVQSQASALTGIIPASTTWSAITSTYDGTTYMPAAANAPTFSGVPIYNTAGQQVLDSGGDLYYTDQLLSNPIQYDQYGNELQTGVWTGGNPVVFEGGLGYPYPFGTEIYGQTPFTNSAWYDAGPAYPSDTLSLYALSSEITVTPEPASLTLLGPALLGLGIVYLRRRGAKA